MTTESAEIQYLRGLINEAGWEDRSHGGSPPAYLQLSRGDETIHMEQRFNGGDPYYVIQECPPRLRAQLSAERIRPARRRA